MSISTNKGGEGMNKSFKKKTIKHDGWLAWDSVGLFFYENYPDRADINPQYPAYEKGYHSVTCVHRPRKRHELTEPVRATRTIIIEIKEARL